jgi:hypothetical protein
MANTDYRSEQLVASIRLMIGRRVAGLAAVVSEMAPELIDELNGYGIPVVFYDVGAPRQNITNIRVNYGRGMETPLRICTVWGIGVWALWGIMPPWVRFMNAGMCCWNRPFASPM